MILRHITHIASMKFLAVILIAAWLFPGCAPDPPPKYSHEIVRTYAELIVFHEKQKLVGMIPDTLYRERLKDFFAERKTDEGKFKDQITQISRDGTTWRVFLNEVTAAVDSIKSAKPS